jgi:hypothetical protein
MTLRTAALLLRSCCEEATSLLQRRFIAYWSMVLEYLVSTTEPCHTQARDGLRTLCTGSLPARNGDDIIALQVQSIAPSATMPFGFGRESWGPKPMVQAVQQKVDHRCRVQRECL